MRELRSPVELKTDHRRPLDRVAHKGIAGVFKRKPQES
jgi:hypothetical protein